jgi:hypothetical protein
MHVPKTTKYMIELLPECQELLAVMRESDVMKAALCKLQSRIQELLKLIPEDRAQQLEQLGYAKMLTEPHKQLRNGSRVCRMSSEMMEICTVRDMRLTAENGGYTCSLGLCGQTGPISTLYVTWQYDAGMKLYGGGGYAGVGGGGGGILVLCDD